MNCGPSYEDHMKKGERVYHIKNNIAQAEADLEIQPPKHIPLIQDYIEVAKAAVSELTAEPGKKVALPPVTK